MLYVFYWVVKKDMVKNVIKIGIVFGLVAVLTGLPSSLAFQYEYDAFAEVEFSSNGDNFYVSINSLQVHNPKMSGEFTVHVHMPYAIGMNPPQDYKIETYCQFRISITLAGSRAEELDHTSYWVVEGDKVEGISGWGDFYYTFDLGSRSGRRITVWAEIIWILSYWNGDQWVTEHDLVKTDSAGAVMSDSMEIYSNKISSLESFEQTIQDVYEDLSLS